MCSYIVTPVGTVGAVGIVTHQGGMVGGALNRFFACHPHAIPQFAQRIDKSHDCNTACTAGQEGGGERLSGLL